MQAAIKNGNVSKAAQYLESLPLAETTAAVLQQMRDLHTSEAPPVAADVEAAPIQLDMGCYIDGDAQGGQGMDQTAKAQMKQARN